MVASYFSKTAVVLDFWSRN